MKKTNRLRAPLYLALALLGLVAGPAATTAAPRAHTEPAVIVPTEKIVLFNGKDLTNFYTHLVDYKYTDPKRVFTVVEQVDGAPAIRVSGEGLGGFITNSAYANYHLVAEYRWGDLTWGHRVDRAMDSGILVHCRGPDGNSRADFNGPWMNSIEYQLIEGATGDFIRVRGHDIEGNRLAGPTCVGTVRTMRNGQTNYDPNGVPKVFDENSKGRLCVSYKDPDWGGELGYRGANDVENPVGQWNKAEIICKDDMVICLLNGQVVNKATRCNFTQGKILFQSEGAEVFFRRIELYPVQ
jgi:hypothetical protein